MTVPDPIAGMISLATLRRISPSGSIVMATSLAATAAAAVAAASTPSGTGAAMSKPATS